MAKINEKFMERLRELEADREYWDSLTPNSKEIIELREMLGYKYEETDKCGIRVKKINLMLEHKGLSRKEFSIMCGKNHQWYSGVASRGYTTSINITKMSDVLGINKEIIKR